MKYVIPIGLILLLNALILLEAIAPSHAGQFPGRYLLISAVGFAALIVLAKVLLPRILSKPEERDDW